MRCPNCQTELPIDAVTTALCPRCGHQLTEPELHQWLDELEAGDGISAPGGGNNRNRFRRSFCSRRWNRLRSRRIHGRR